MLLKTITEAIGREMQADRILHTASESNCAINCKNLLRADIFKI